MAKLDIWTVTKFTGVSERTMPPLNHNVIAMTGRIVIKLNLTSLRTINTIMNAKTIATTKLSWKLSVISSM